jgi:trimeric autotransporter adhesin
MLVLLMPVRAAQGQCTPHWDSGPAVAGFSSPPKASIGLPNGDIIVGGSFVAAGHAAASNIARFDAASGTWTAMGAGTNGAVRALAVLSNGDVVVGGSFSLAGGITARGIARYTPSTGAWHALGGGLNVGGEVFSLAVLPNGRLVVAGGFSTAGPVAANNIALYELSSDSFASCGSGTSAIVYALAALPSGDFLAGGGFSVSGVLGGNIARFSPVAGTWSSVAGGVSGGSIPVLAMLVLPSGDVLVGGGLDHAGGQSVTHLVRYDTQVNTWTDVGLGGVAINAMALLPGGDVILGLNGTSTVPNAGSGSFAQFNPASGSWFLALGGVVYTVATLADGTVVLGGQLTQAGDARVLNGARYDPASHTFASLFPGSNGRVLAMDALPGGDVVIGGEFTIAGGTAANYIARYGLHTRTFTALADGTDASVLSLVTLPGGDVLAGGTFRNAGGVPAACIARYHVATGAWSAVGGGMGGNNSPYVRAMCMHPDGSVIVAGSFTLAGGQPASGIARLDPTTETWSSLGSGLLANGGPTVYSIACAPNGDILAGGIFTFADVVVATRNIARYSWATGAWSALGSGSSTSVQAVGFLPSGVPLLSAFAQPNVQAFDAASGTWGRMGAFASSTGSIRRIMMMPSGDLVIGGTFTTAGNITAANIARYTPATDRWSSLGAGVNTTVWAIASTPAGDIFSGGEFTLAGGNASAYLGLWTARPRCTADFDCSGATNIQDIFAFLAAWFQGDPAADLSGDGVGVQDIFDFLNQWFAGC